MYLSGLSVEIKFIRAALVALGLFFLDSLITNFSAIKTWVCETFANIGPMSPYSAMPIGVFFMFSFFFYTLRYYL